MSSQNNAVRLFPETLRTLAYTAISSSYAAVGTAFANPIRIMMLMNDTDMTLTFSMNGINDHFVLVAGGQFILDVGSNSSLPAGSLYFGQGQFLYVKGAPGTGSVYLSVFYGISPQG